MSAPTWLNEVCHAEREGLTAPFSYTHEGRILTVATNGHRLVALDADYGCPAAADHLCEARGLPTILAPTPRGVAFDGASFRHFLASVVPIQRPCVACKRTGEVWCSACEGDGCTVCKLEGVVPCLMCRQSPLKPCRVRIDATFFNANYLAYPPEMLGNRPLTLYLNPDPALAAHFYGDGFRLVLMPLRDIGAAALGTFSLGDAP